MSPRQAIAFLKRSASSLTSASCPSINVSQIWLTACAHFEDSPVAIAEDSWLAFDDKRYPAD